MPVSLHTTELGDHGSRIVFCHGLFGQGRNWTQIGKALAGRPPGAAGRHAPPRPVAVGRALRLPRRRRPGGRAARPPTTRWRWSGTRWAARSRWCWRCGTPSWSSGSASSTSRRWPTTTAREFARLHRGDAGRWTSTALDAARRRRGGAGGGGAQPDGARLPAAEPAARRRRLALAGQPRRARPRPRRARRLARGRAGRRPRRTTGRCCGSAGADSRLRRATSTPRRWTAGSRATGG